MYGGTLAACSGGEYLCAKPDLGAHVMGQVCACNNTYTLPCILPSARIIRLSGLLAHIPRLKYEFFEKISLFKASAASQTQTAKKQVFGRN